MYKFLSKQQEQGKDIFDELKHDSDTYQRPVQAKFDTTDTLGVPKLTHLVLYKEVLVVLRFA